MIVLILMKDVKGGSLLPFSFAKVSHIDFEIQYKEEQIYEDNEKKWNGRSISA